MSEWRAFAQLFRTPKSDVAVLLTTFLLTVLIDLTVAVQVGVVLAAFLFIKRMADVTNVGVITRELRDAPDGTMWPTPTAWRGGRSRGRRGLRGQRPVLLRRRGQDQGRARTSWPRSRSVFILRMRNVPAIDASGIRVLDDLFRSFSHQGIRFLIAGIHAQPLAALERAGKLDEYGRENFVGELDDALERAREILASGRGAV